MSSALRRCSGLVVGVPLNSHVRESEKRSSFFGVWVTSRKQVKERLKAFTSFLSASFPVTHWVTFYCSCLGKSFVWVASNLAVTDVVVNSVLFWPRGAGREQAQQSRAGCTSFRHESFSAKR